MRSMVGISTGIKVARRFQQARAAPAPRQCKAVVDSAMSLPFWARQFQDIAGESAPFAPVNVDDLMTGRAQLGQHGRAVRLVDDRFAADNGKAGADRHQHVGVINGGAARIHGIEGHELIVQLLCELAEHIKIGARRGTRVSHPVNAVENDAAGAFEILLPRPRDA